jgi:hypothetical protein
MLRDIFLGFRILCSLQLGLASDKNHAFWCFGGTTPLLDLGFRFSNMTSSGTKSPKSPAFFWGFPGDADGESVKILLYLFGFLLFGTFLVFLPGYLGLR